MDLYKMNNSAHLFILTPAMLFSLFSPRTILISIKLYIIKELAFYATPSKILNYFKL